MFVFSLKASKLKYLLTAMICTVVVVAVITLMPETEHTVKVNGMLSQYENEKKISFDDIDDTEDIIELAQSLGYTLEQTPVETVNMKIPSKLDAVLLKYNELQKQQGFNLAKYKNKKVTRYTFKVLELPQDSELPKEPVLLSVILYKDEIIGADVYYSGLNAVVKPFLT